MNATRPQSVPEDATLIPPVFQAPISPQQNIQAATIAAIEAQDAHMNANTNLRNARAIEDWKLNCQQAAALGLRLPPRPILSPVWVTNVVYADAAGEIVPAPAGADGSHYAWVWETQETPA